jgi:hypothetical protein
MSGMETKLERFGAEPIDEVLSIVGVGPAPDHVAGGTKHSGWAYLERGYCPKGEKRVDGFVGLKAKSAFGRFYLALRKLRAATERAFL